MFNICVLSTNLGNGHDDGPEGGEVLRVAERRVGAAAPRHVDIEPEPGARAALGGGAGAREEVPVVVPVDAHVEHVRVLVEYLLRAVSVVYIL